MKNSKTERKDEGGCQRFWKQLVAYAKSLELSAYTSVSAQPVIQNVARAKAMLANAEVTQEEVNDMVETLQASVDNLVEVSTDSTTAGTDTTDTTNTAAASQGGSDACAACSCRCSNSDHSQKADLIIYSKLNRGRDVSVLFRTEGQRRETHPSNGMTT